MEKSRLGISLGVMAALVYVVALFGGYVATILLVGYVLLMESNDWLRMNAVRALATMAFFSFIICFIGLIPDVFSWLSSFVGLFGDSFQISIINKVVNLIISLINIFKDVLFIILILKSLNCKNVSIPVVDGILNKYMQ